MELKNKSISEIYKETKLSDEVMKDILKIGDESFEKLCKEKFKLEEINEKEEKRRELLRECYLNIKDILKKYLDWEEEKYIIVSIWIIGTYFHSQFPTFPYLYLNAMKSSGKTRALNIITSLSKNGSLLNSLTEAVLFRTKGTLGIDEFEGIERKGKESLRELLNSAYKKGVSVKRMKKVKTINGEEQVVEEFDVYRPIVMANISGIENVLEDRCISLIIEKSFKSSVTDLMEIFREEIEFKKTKELLNRVVSVDVYPVWNVIEMYKEWNNYVINIYTNYTNHTNYTNYTNYIQALKSLNLQELGGRYLELSFPLILIAGEISSELQKETTLILKNIFNSKKEENITENLDISLIDFVSQEPENSEMYFVRIIDLFNNFQQFTQIHEDWFNTKWLGRALKRLNLIINKRRKGHGIEVRLNIKKAQEKIKQFKK